MMYRVTCEGETFLFEIGGNWNKEFWDTSSHDEIVQAVIPVWNEIERFLRGLDKLPGNAAGKDRSMKVKVDMKNLEVSFVLSTKSRCFWVDFPDGSHLEYGRVMRHPAWMNCSSMKWLVWFLDHLDDVLSAMTTEDTGGDPVSGLPDDPRYLIRVARKIQVVDDTVCRNAVVERMGCVQ